MRYIRRVSKVKNDDTKGYIINSTNVEDKTTNTYSANIIDTMIAVGGGTDGGSVDISTIIDLIYPIGRGFIDFTDTDYSNWLGLTWERELIGMTPIGKNANDTDFNTVGKTGGEKTHTLTINEMPSHNHTVNLNYAQSDLEVQTMPEHGFIINSGHLYKTPGATWNGGTTYFGYTSSIGSNKAHNIMQPYQVVSYWKRVTPNAKTMISFTIAPGGTNTGDSVIYQAEEGMTFLEWYNSDYNTWDTNKSYYTSTSDTFSSGGSSLYYENTKTSEYIYGKDTIINGTTVYWYSSEK